MSDQTLKLLKSLLQQFSDGKIELPNLLNHLAPYLDADFSLAPGRRIMRRNELQNLIELTITRAQLIHMLNMFNSGKIDGSMLSDWAAFIYMSDIYSATENDTEEDEVLWDVLQQLMTPSVFGSLSERKIESYIGSLSTSPHRSV